MVLPDACAKAVHDSPDLWSETVVGPSKTKLPRVKVAAVPYALEAAVAGVAEKAGGALAGEISGLSGKVSGAEGKIAQLELEVAALKGGGSGGSAGSAGPGGPVMVDSNGTVVGTFTTLTYGSNTYSVLTTKTGWNVWLSPETSPLRFGPKGGAVFKSADCSGTPYFLRDSVSFVGRNTAMIFSDGTAWFRFKPSVVDPNLPEETKVTIMSARQFSGTCTKLTLGDSYVFEGVSIPLLESGMPSASMGPWYWSKP